MEEYPPTSAEIPTALVDCPRCSNPIHVVLRSQPPTAHPTSFTPPPIKPPTHCPHCGSRIWIALRARAPVAMPVQPKTTALIPRVVDPNAATRLDTKREGPASDDHR